MCEYSYYYTFLDVDTFLLVERRSYGGGSIYLGRVSRIKRAHHKQYVQHLIRSFCGLGVYWGRCPDDLIQIPQPQRFFIGSNGVKCVYSNRFDDTFENRLRTVYLNG